MPEQPMELDQQAKAVLDAVREQQGLETREQAAEWLLRRRIRRGAQGLTGRGRALYEVKGDPR
ncbi:hypothetical protein AOR11_24540 [Vibrio alginolyticus]|uniref:Uncharacterized protein n=1 Tax=Pseudoalteromonas lipolytica TaxID=570156 RepID=A0A0N8HH62_9GAMM|nr:MULTISPECIES: hypothetical protein [Gammaproteobacteria]KPL92075.1 hypothetical protein AN167_26525 [Vibrio splendidus]KPM74592.1 hypothetical protein AOG27_20990 [Pseudoalteromonas lipolytica]KPM95204.1 hypothetical protein AOR11_24540 [Vibrio alginolyticus]